ncbi:hypothetical protein Y032_0184g1007 [Ancylostoma ceylanicum]|uniref:Uncharacterized protein n=1 Tax=Ancylostoma ceylanicum TaxID=53326 RepID=A0A016SSC0_9BILA|nr:hypothetical protein Y032_0184g1007 [Ancylostoma ceylanicum]
MSRLIVEFLKQLPVETRFLLDISIHSGRLHSGFSTDQGETSTTDSQFQIFSTSIVQSRILEFLMKY